MPQISNFLGENFAKVDPRIYVFMLGRYGGLQIYLC